MKRIEFLIEFLGALGAESIEWDQEINNYISGKVIYDKTDPEEMQFFCWHKSETEAPSNSAYNLASLLNKNKLLSIDQITISRKELRLKYNELYSLNTTEQEFSVILEELEMVEVPMVDDGEETDAYFIHE